MRFRPANIRLINRRSKLPRLLLALSLKNGKSNNNGKNNPTDALALTGSLHIRAFLLMMYSIDGDCPRRINGATLFR
jgi:hypothetical protein